MFPLLKTKVEGNTVYQLIMVVLVGSNSFSKFNPNPFSKFN